MASQLQSSEWSLQAAIAAAGGLADQAAHATFQPSKVFLGPRPGFFFGTGEQGTGYYLDPKQQEKEAQGAEEEAEPERAKKADPDELLKQAEEEAHIDQIQTLDAKGLKRIVTALDKKYKENLELRMKYAEQPEKFLDSEVDLDEQIKTLLQVAGSPELYPLLVELNPFPTIMSCLSHENTDVAGDTVELLMELTDQDVLEEHYEEARSLVAALLENNVLELLVQRLTNFNEKVDEEAKAVFNCLNTFENMIETDPSIAEQVTEKTKLMKWLLGRIRPREFDSNKQQASELLAILVQGSEANQKRLGELNGIDILLQCVALYKGRDPGTLEEEEFMQDCFDVLCSAMMLPENKQAFVKAEGVELMWLMLANKRQSRHGALKLLDFASTRYAAPCEKLVDLGGLKHLFGAFMGKAKIRGPTGDRDVEREVEERCVSLVASLFTNLGPKGGRRERVGAKFVENEFEKADRLLEIYFRYYDRVVAQEALLEQKLSEENDEDEEITPEQIWMARMDGGLFTLHQAALVLAHAWALGDAGLRKRILGVLHQRSHSLGHVRSVLLEYYGSIGDDGQPDEVARLRSRVRDALMAIGATPEEIEQQLQQQQQQQQQQRGAQNEEPAADGARPSEAENGDAARKEQANGEAPNQHADMDVAMDIEEGEAPTIRKEQEEEQKDKKRSEAEDDASRGHKKERERAKEKERPKDKEKAAKPEREEEDDSRRERKERRREKEREEDRRAEEEDRGATVKKEERASAREDREREEERAARKEKDKDKERRRERERDEREREGSKRGREESGGKDRDREERKEKERRRDKEGSSVKDKERERERHSSKRSRRSRSP